MALIQRDRASGSEHQHARDGAHLEAGCIIRAKFLDSIMRAYEHQPDLPNLLLASEFSSHIQARSRHGDAR